MSDQTLHQHLTEAMKQALKANDKQRLAVIRLMLAAIKQQEIDSRTSNAVMDDTAVLSILDKMLKQRRDSEQQYRDANRMDLADQERYEITVIEEYLPTPLSETEVDTLIKDAIHSTGASSVRDMAKVMAVLKPEVQGRADMKVISDKVKSKLG